MLISHVYMPAYDNTSADEGSLKVLSQLMEFTGPRFVIEAGTYQGHFAVMAGWILTNQQRGGKVWTFDPVDCEIAGWLERNHITNVVYTKAGFEELATRFPFLPGVVDLAFIDSGPIGEAPDGFETDMRWKHFTLAKDYVRHGGLVVVDDVFGQWDHVEDVRNECLLLEGGRGLGVWQKR